MISHEKAVINDRVYRSPLGAIGASPCPVRPSSSSHIHPRAVQKLNLNSSPTSHTCYLLLPHAMEDPKNQIADVVLNLTTTDSPDVQLATIERYILYATT